MIFSRIRCDEPDHGRTKSPPPEDAYVVQVMMRDMKDAQLWMYGREVYAQDVPRGDMYLYHLETDPIASYHSSFDTMRIASRPCLSAAGSGTSLFSTTSRLPHAHLSRTYLGRPIDERTHRGGLSPWKERREKEYIEAHLDGAPGLAVLAEQCGLSISHFTRAFRTATGRSPYQWMLERRVEAAKQMLVADELSLAQIARASGFANGSHFSRVFARVTGEAPGAWRRMRKVIV